jgi:hypothetical protein
VLFLDLGAERGDIALVAKTVEDDIASSGRESFGGGEAEALRRSGDERAFSLQHSDCSL